ncbi:MAG: hypothetical protein JSS74_14905 [Actinobacteria bacterium]|nr:hypothetical protein [Actinomycetota bacterium]
MTETETPSARLRLRLRRAAGAFAVAVGLLLPAAMPAPAFAAETPAPTPTPTPEHAGLQLWLQPDANGTYLPGAPLTGTLTLRNDATSGVGAGTVHVELGKSPLADRRAVAAWLDGSASADLHAIGDVRTTVIDAGGTTRTPVSLAAADVGALTPGVYPLRATLDAPASGADAPKPGASARTALVVAQGAPATVLTVVPITAKPSGSLLTATELTTLTAPAGALTAQLNGISGTSAVLAIDPSIAAAIRVLGANAPASATAWLSRLESLSNDRFALQFGDADATAQAAAGLTAPLAVTDYAPFLTPAGAAPTTPTPTPAATGPTAQQPSPDAIAGARSDLLWPRGQVTAEQVVTMSHYVSGPGSATILPSSTFTAGADDAPVAARATVDGASVLVTDDAVSTALSDAAVQGDANERGHDLTEANAMLWFAAPGSTVLAGLARADARSEPGLTGAITAFAAAPDVRLDRIQSAAAAPLAVATSTAEDRAAAVLALSDDAGRLAQFATILDRPADLIVRDRISTLRLLGVGVHTSPDDFAAALREHRVNTEKTMAAVGIQPSNPILISAKVDVPVWVRNDLPYPVHVRLNASTSDARVEVPAVTEVDAQPSSTTRVKLPLESHVANTELSLTMTLTSPTGVPIGPTQTARLTIRAEWETIGLIIFGSLGVLLIGAGIYRTIRRRKAVAAKNAAEGMNGSESAAGGSGSGDDDTKVDTDTAEADAAPVPPSSTGEESNE